MSNKLYKPNISGDTIEYIEIEWYFEVAVTKRTKNEQDILKLILKEIKEIKEDVSVLKDKMIVVEQDISVLKQDMTLVKNCPTIARELKELQANS